MNQAHSFILACIIAGICSIATASPSVTLESGFNNPPTEAKARTWWHWINGNVTKEGITADLEAMKRVGIQEAQIFNVDQGYPEGPATYMSSYWLEMFRFAVEEAERLGLEIGFHNGAGWSSSGGPWITPEYAMQTVVYSEVQYKGKQKLKTRLPQPPTKLDYYKDIAVFAFPTPTGKERIDELALKTLSTHSFKSHLQPDSKTIDPASVIHRKDIIDLTGKMTTDGILEWTMPEGEWTILRIGHTPHGTENRPAGIGGRGLECDKLSRTAMDVYWKGGIKPIIDKVGPLVGSSLTNCIIDSYEVGCNNWTTGFNQEFEQRRSYDCMPFLPTLAGYYVESGEITERFLWDFRRTIGDMMADNYYAYFGELCHQHGMKFSVEPYGGPFEALQAGSTADIVMSEFWVGNNVFLDSPKLVASIAHLNGNSIVGAESFTSTGGWLNHPATLKQIGDWVWSEGVNRFIFHTYTHQPWNTAPGMTFHMYGLEMNRHNTWWEQGRAYMDYLARSQFMLQQGRNAADVLVFTGESSPNDGLHRPDIKALGYDYDEIGTTHIKSLTVKDGWLCTPAGGIYKLLVLPETNRMTPELIEKIGSLAHAGAIIIGPRPERSPSLQGFPRCDDHVARLAAEIWNNSSSIEKGKVTANLSVKEALQNADLPPDFSTEATGSDLSFIHRIAVNADIYFIANPQKESRRETCRFRVSGKQPEFWNPLTGEIKKAVVWKGEDGGITTMPVYLEEEESVFVVFRETPSASDMQILEAHTELTERAFRPLTGLEIIRAEYGTFLPDGLADVTKAANVYLSQGRSAFPANNDLAGYDPAAGSIKELRIEYEVDGQRRIQKAVENTPFMIDADNSEKIKIIRAVYGKFPADMHGVPPNYPVYDVKEELNKMIADGKLFIQVNDNLTGVVPVDNGQKKELRLTYSAGGETQQIVAVEGRTVSFASGSPEPELICENERIEWLTPYPGKITYLTTSGPPATIQVKSVPAPVELAGPWELNFPPDLGAPAKAQFDELVSWSSSSDEGIRYFSGTAVYHKQFKLSKKLVNEKYSLELDLGNVKVIAEVIVNGKNTGILWKAPFRIKLDDYVHVGVNDLEIRVTNLWPNRLIGDEHLPDDCERGDWVPASWPDWLINNTERPSGRVTFTTWKHWHKDSPLQVSGLLGPVYIRPYVKVALEK